MVSINWPAKIINVAIADLTPVATGIYSFDIDHFRLTLKELEEGDEGIIFPDTHRHQTTVTVGGVTLARVVEIINGYQITFENGAYAVNLAGANSNISDVTTVNNVSIRSANSAGLVQISTGSGLSSEQDLRLTQLAATLASAGIFSEEALANTPSSGGGGLTAQQVADALRLAPAAGTPAAGSVYADIDEIKTIATAAKNNAAANL